MFASPLKRLRQSSWLEAIPDTITVPAIAGRPGRTVSIERATLDDIALALVALSEQHAALCRLTGALREVLDLARKQGAVGADNAISAAARQLGERK